MTAYPAISLHQPWASLIAAGAKPFETRGWPPPLRLIGKRIAIHAAKKPVGKTWLSLDKETREAMILPLLRAGFDELSYFPLGAVVCTAILSGAYKMLDDSRGRSLTGEICKVVIDQFGDYSPGRWAWRLTEMERLDPPVPARGAQNFWYWEDRHAA